MSAPEEITPTSDRAINWRAADWQVGLGYALFFAGIAAFTPYAAIYYRSLGFSGLQVGLLTSMPAIGMILTGAFWGTIADAFAAHRTLLRASLASSAVLAFVASRFDGFALLFCWITLLSFTTVPLRSLFDHYAVTVGEHLGKPFGRIRLWGAFGYSAFVVTLGRIMSAQVTSVFLVGYAIALAGTFAATFGLPKLERRKPERLIDGVGDVLRNPSFRLLLAFAFVTATLHFGIVVSLGVHIIGGGGTTAQVGIAFAVAALSELPIFFAGVWLVRRLGHVRLINIVGVLWTVRMIALAAVSAPLGVIALQLLHGVTFGAYLVAAVPFARGIAGRNYPATAQAVLTMAFFGFGTISGSMLASVLMARTTTSAIYWGLAVAVAAVTVLHAVGQRAILRRTGVTEAA